jgi:hypothetical protein
VTDAAGVAQATVEGLNKGETDIEAKAQNQSAKTHVKVPTVSFWGLLILALIVLFLLQRRARKPEA